MEEDTNLVELIIAKGYTPENARKVVEDVLTARREARELALHRYIGKRVRAQFGELMFEVLCKDVKLNNEGKVELQVTPLNGSKSAWIRHFTV